MRRSRRAAFQAGRKSSRQCAPYVFKAWLTGIAWHGTKKATISPPSRRSMLPRAIGSVRSPRSDDASQRSGLERSRCLASREDEQWPLAAPLPHGHAVAAAADGDQLAGAVGHVDVDTP